MDTDLFVKSQFRDEEVFCGPISSEEMQVNKRVGGGRRTTMIYRAPDPDADTDDEQNLDECECIPLDEQVEDETPIDFSNPVRCVEQRLAALKESSRKLRIQLELQSLSKGKKQMESINEVFDLTCCQLRDGISEEVSKQLEEKQAFLDRVRIKRIELAQKLATTKENAPN